MERTNADIVEMGFNRVLGPIKRKNPFRVKPGTITNPELFDKYYISFFGKNLLSVNCCGKLYRVSTLKKARLKPTGYKMGEDLMFNLMLFPNISTYSIINYNGYNYRIGGLTSHYNPSLWTDLKSQFIEKRNEAISHDYHKGLRLLSIELKNIFLSAIQQRIIYLNEPESNLTNWIRQELESHIWDDIIIMAPNESDPIYQYIADKDAVLILNIAKSRVKSTAFRRLVKKTLSIIIR